MVCTAKDQLFFNRTESCLFEEVAYKLIDLQTGKEAGFGDMGPSGPWSLWTCGPGRGHSGSMRP
ncbi:hypothetical protein DL991_31710 [Amycolatopsis sp. WAC 01375]|nr:hypothetical protein DL991_31710 [Amycolatopsis sp. WAC 01375]RSN19914.1 hypothetical protein DL990_40830 [Amycolatopsis sp. WAC 01416]